MEGGQIIFCSWWYDAIEELPEELQLDAYRAIMRYAFCGELPQSKVIKAVLTMIFKWIDKDKERYAEICQKRKEAGIRGAQRRWNGKCHNGIANGNKCHSEDGKTWQTMPNKHINNKHINTDIEDTNVSMSEAERSDEGAAAEKIDYEGVLKAWNATCKSFPKVSKLTPARKEKIKLRLKEMGGDMQTLQRVFDKLEASDFAREGTWASFDWVFRSENNWIKTLEGNYDNKADKRDFRGRVDTTATSEEDYSTEF